MTSKTPPTTPCPSVMWRTLILRKRWVTTGSSSFWFLVAGDSIRLMWPGFGEPGRSPSKSSVKYIQTQIRLIIGFSGAVNSATKVKQKQKLNNKTGVYQIIWAKHITLANWICNSRQNNTICLKNQNYAQCVHVCLIIFSDFQIPFGTRIFNVNRFSALRIIHVGHCIEMGFNDYLLRVARFSRRVHNWKLHVTVQ